MTETLASTSNPAAAWERAVSPSARSRSSTHSARICSLQQIAASVLSPQKCLINFQKYCSGSSTGSGQGHQGYLGSLSASLVELGSEVGSMM